MTFNDTVFCQHSSLSLSLSSAGYDNNCTACVVEFYLDWCGYCRTYAQTYKSLARDIHGWNKMVQSAVVNCADTHNEITCQTNSALFFPHIKYFPQNSSNPNNAISIETSISPCNANLVDDASYIQNFPSAAIFKCEQMKPFFVANISYLKQILKAMRYALFDEVTRSGKYLTGNNLTDIRDFYDVLAKNFPTKTIYYNIIENKQLSESKQAVHLFEKMRNYLDQKGMKDEHCAGSIPKFRSYSYGLWTFHALSGLNVNNFFGCQHCREHFLRMTTQTFHSCRHEGYFNNEQVKDFLLINYNAVATMAKL
uniref:C2H2-type domain-containing protein n=1 Tax=Wuchereria bancrofti TaxID=6293 RepID=A0AAF5Q5B9_WUCBA